MINSLIKKALMGLVCLIFLSPPVEAESYRSGVKKGAKSDLEYYSPQIRRLNDGGRICSLGIQSTWDGVITRVSDNGASKGLQPGDKILAVDGTEITDLNRNEVFLQFVPGDSLVISVERNGTKIDLEIVCDDGTERDKAFNSMLQAAAKGRWQECIDQSYKADHLNGTRISFSARYRNNCSEAIRCGSFGCKIETNHTASLVYDLRRLDIEEAIVAGKLDDLRSNVLSSISWLEKTGFRRFARELESELRAAESSPPPTVAERATPSVATTAHGTCFAVSESEVLTSHHIVDGASLITVQFQAGGEIGAVVSQQSQSTDLALLKISRNAPAILPLAPMRSLEVGQEVFTVGFPVTSILGSDAKFTEGSVSALSGIQNDASYFQMSVPIQPGNSGGPVVNMRGEVVGIVTSTAAIVAFYTMSGSLPQNVNWASKSDYARLLFDTPGIEKRAKDRADAIKMAYSAICKVKAVRN